MGAFRDLFRAVRVSNAMAREREKFKKMVALIDEATAKIYANGETNYASLAAFKDIRDAAERVAREPQVIAAAAAVAALRARICDAFCAVDRDRQLDLAAASAPTVLGDLGKALNDAYLHVLMLDPQSIRSNEPVTVPCSYSYTFEQFKRVMTENWGLSTEERELRNKGKMLQSSEGLVSLQDVYDMLKGSARPS